MSSTIELERGQQNVLDILSDVHRGQPIRVERRPGGARDDIRFTLPDGRTVDVDVDGDRIGETAPPRPAVRVMIHLGAAISVEAAELRDLLREMSWQATGDGGRISGTVLGDDYDLEWSMA